MRVNIGHRVAVIAHEIYIVGLKRENTGCGNRQNSAKKRAVQALPAHWTPEQALAVFEAVEFLRESLWARYGRDIQRAWREQLLCDADGTELDSEAPF